MNDSLDDALDARFRDEAAYIDDAGFTQRVMQQLPARPTSSFAQVRAMIIFLAALLAAVTAYFVSGEGLFLRESILRASALSPLLQIALACSIGILLTMGGLWAALSRSRDPLR